MSPIRKVTAITTVFLPGCYDWNSLSESRGSCKNHPVYSGILRLVQEGMYHSGETLNRIECLMYKPVHAIEVRIWGKTVGAVALDPRLGYYAFEYDPAFATTIPKISPLSCVKGRKVRWKM